jgi:hypothetical protein
MSEQGADELRMKAILKTRGVGPDAPPPPPPAGDWWEPKPEPFLEDIEDEDEDEEELDDDEPAPRRFEAQPGYWPRPHTPAAVNRLRDRAPAAVSPRHPPLPLQRQRRRRRMGPRPVRQVRVGHQRLRHPAGHRRRHRPRRRRHLLIAHVWDRRTRHWWPGIAWAARIPLATALLALALWAPAAH